MATSQPAPSVPGSRVRIAISSPEILAHICEEFAGEGLEARIDGLPVVDVVVTWAPGAATLGDALNRLAGDGRPPATASYRLALAPGRTAGAQHDAAGPAHAVSRSLSAREAEVMESIGRGMRNADIAASLHVREKTVKNHVNRIFTKLGARTRVEAVLIWQGGGGAPPG